MRVWLPLAVIAVTAGFIRVVAALVSGLSTASDHLHDLPAQAHAGETLQAFGGAGGLEGAVLAVVGVGCCAVAGSRARVTATAARWLVALTALSIVAATVGALILVTSIGTGETAEASRAVGEGLAALLVCVGGAAAVARLGPPGADSPDAMPPIVFAVDRVDGEVFAARSFQDLARVVSVYSIEDDEFEFFTADGRVVTATTAEGRAAFDVTEFNRRDDLLTGLRRFATAHELDVAPEQRDDPTAYVEPIEEWQALELWPPWMRPIVRLVRRLRGL